jgi:uncharacterized protein
MACIFAGSVGKDDDFHAGRRTRCSANNGDDMLYAVLFTDDPDHAEARQRLMPDHLAFLEKNASRIRAAGPLHDASTSEAAGGLWLVEAADPAAVKALYESDPFWPTGLRRAVRVLRWTQVFADGQRATANHISIRAASE